MPRRIEGFYDVVLGDEIEDINHYDYALDSTIVVPYPYPPKHQFFYVLKVGNIKGRGGKPRGTIICIKREDGKPEFREVIQVDGNCLILDRPMNKIAKVGGSVTRVLGHSTHYVNQKSTEKYQKLLRKQTGGAWV